MSGARDQVLAPVGSQLKVLSTKPGFLGGCACVCSKDERGDAAFARKRGVSSLPGAQGLVAQPCAMQIPAWGALS